MDDLAFYFSNTESYTVDAKRCEKQPRGRKHNRKFTRPISMYFPSDTNATVCSSSFTDFRNFGVCEFCRHGSRAIEEDRKSFIQNNDCCSCVSVGLPNQLPPEVEVGNIEYKRKLVNPTPDRFEHLVTQMKWRLNEGGGEAIYRLGVEDDGHIAGLTSVELASSLNTLERMATRLNATVHLLREKTIDHVSLPNSCQSNLPDLRNNQTRRAMELLVRQSPSVNHGRPSVCIAVLGAVDVGKSTLIGVLTDGELDNARGRARLNLFRHLHEVQSGRTSCLSSELLGFNTEGNVTNYARTDGHLSRVTVDELVRNSSQLVTLLDSAGHSKYQRTTLAGLARAQPVGVLLVVSATTGLTAVGLDHAQLSFTLGLPMAVVISKIDQLVSGVDRSRQISSMYRQIALRFSQLKVAIQDKTHMDTLINTLFFPVSAVTGEGLDRLLCFLSHIGTNVGPEPATQLLMPSRFHDKQHRDRVHNEPPSTADDESSQRYKENLFKQGVDRLVVSTMLTHGSPFMCFWVSEVFTSVPGVPHPVLFGNVQSGQLITDHLAWLGPDQSGEFYLIQIMSLHHNRQPHSVIYAGQTTSVAVRFLVNLPNTMTKSLNPLAATVAPSSPVKRRSTIPETLFEPDNDENVPHSTDSTFSLPTDHLLPVVLRRGMVLLSNLSWSASYGDLLNSPHHLPLKVSHMASVGQSVGVTWTVELELLYRLSIFPGATGSPVVIPPLPLLKQRVALYAGCVAQPAVVTLESNLMRPLDEIPRLRVRFTRNPEYIDVGRQVILTWASCAKAVGRVSALYDLVPSKIPIGSNACWLNTRARLEVPSEFVYLPPNDDAGSFFNVLQQQAVHTPQFPCSSPPDTVYLSQSLTTASSHDSIVLQDQGTAIPICDTTLHDADPSLLVEIPPVPTNVRTSTSTSVTEDVNVPPISPCSTPTSVSSTNLVTNLCPPEPTGMAPPRRPSQWHRRRRKLRR